MDKQQLQIISPDSIAQKPNIGNNQNVITLTSISYNEDKLDKKTITDTQHVTVYHKKCILAYHKQNQFNLVCGIIDDHGENLEYRQLI